MWRKYAVFFVLLLFACESAIRTTPIEEREEVNTTIELICQNCQPLEECRNGICECQGKKCGDKCLPEESCCNADCEGQCIGNKCVKETPCKVNEEFIDGECACTEETIYCREQQKCISKDSCCRHDECAREERCTPTIWRISMCFEHEERKICRAIPDIGRAELLEIGGLSLRITPKTFWNNGCNYHRPYIKR